MKGKQSNTLKVEFVNCVRFNFFNRGKAANSNLDWCWDQITDQTKVGELKAKIKIQDLFDLNKGENPTKEQEEAFEKAKSHFILSNKGGPCDDNDVIKDYTAAGVFLV